VRSDRGTELGEVLCPATERTGQFLENPVRGEILRVVTAEDLAFLGIAETSLAAFRQQLYPLGCDPEEWKQFVESLQEALASDGITDADVRLQGSAARFFSGLHKKMPYEKEEIAALFLQLRSRVPTRFETERTAKALAETWPPEGNRPRRRPFDALFQLNIDRFPSDIDVQISSAQIVERVKAHLERVGLPPSKMLTENAKYSFVLKEHVGVLCPYLTHWALLQTDILRRPVTVAVFDRSGPPEIPEQQSSHHQHGDWRVPMGARR